MLVGTHVCVNQSSYYSKVNVCVLMCTDKSAANYNQSNLCGYIEELLTE